MKNFHWYFFILFYSIFFIWYSNLSGPLNDEEIDSFMKVISERSGNDEQNIQRLRKFMEYMYPEMFKRASHPIFFSEVFFPAMDIVSAQGMEEWDNVAFVRYRSRKDMLEIGLNPIFDERHLYKIEALEKTIAIPVETPLLNDLRLILFFLLLTLGLIIDRIRA